MHLEVQSMRENESCKDLHVRFSHFIVSGILRFVVRKPSRIENHTKCISYIALNSGTSVNHDLYYLNLLCEKLWNNLLHRLPYHRHI